MTINVSLIRSSERAHYIMQLASYFSELTDLPGVRFAYTHRLKDIWYNQAYDIEWHSKDIIPLKSIIEEYCSKRDRLPCIYLTPAVKPADLGKRLEEIGYGKFEEETWMFYDFKENSKPYIMPTEISVVEVKSAKEFEMFAGVYRKGLPGPEVEKYIQAVADGLRYIPPLVNIWYFVAKYSDEPAGMLSLLTVGEYAGIYAVATIEKFRGKGVCKALTLHAGRVAERAGSKHMFLQTVVGGDSEIVFRKLGYETLYVREGYTTKDVIAKLQHG